MLFPINGFENFDNILHACFHTHTQSLVLGAVSQLESAYTTTTYGMGKTKSLPAGVAETIP